MSSSPLPPTPRQLLTSILNAISSIPAPEQRQQQLAQGQTATISRVNSLQAGNETQPTTSTTTTTNPLRLIDPAHRSLFTTLHVLFPSLLLPALDLLDRGLVTRLIPRVENDSTDGRTGRDGDTEMRDGGDAEVMKQTTPPPPPSPSPVYLVRSAAQKPTRRPFGGGGGGGGDPTATSSSSSSAQKAYVVQTAAWNCTCAAFAFSAFPPAAGWSSLPLGRAGPAGGKGEVRDEAKAPSGQLHAAAREEAGDGREGDTGGGPAEWQFGGLSYDGCGGSSDGDGDRDGDGEAVPPCCKHLLACVLAERWDATLGRYMVRRTVGREEMAGIFADI